MGLRELKEAAHAQYLRGRFEQCARTYRQILRLAPKDPNLRVRHAEACRRAGDKQGAIASYRTAAQLLLAIGCESRARGALKAALELDPRDAELLADLARLGQSGPAVAPEHERLSSLPTPGVLEPSAPPPPARSMTSTAPARTPRGPGVSAPGPSPTPPVAPSVGAVLIPPPPPGSKPLVRLQAEVRRLSPHALAFRLSPCSRWVLFTSRSPIQVRRVDSLESIQEELRDFALDITVVEKDSESTH